MISGISRITIPERVSIKSYVPRREGHADLSAMRWKWFWKPLWWVLRKLGARYVEPIPECWPVQTRYIRHGQIVSMLEDGGKAMKELWNLKAAILVLGPDEYGKLMHDAPREIMAFEMPVDMVYADVRYEKWKIEPVRILQTRTCNLRVICVPWLEGRALLPDLKEI